MRKSCGKCDVCCERTIFSEYVAEDLLKIEGVFIWAIKKLCIDLYIAFHLGIEFVATLNTSEIDRSRTMRTF